MHGTDLLTMPRRLCKRDVGSHGWTGEGRPDDCLELQVVQQLESGHNVSTVHSELALSLLHAEEEDPLGLGVDIG